MEYRVQILASKAGCAFFRESLNITRNINRNIDSNSNLLVVID